VGGGHASGHSGWMHFGLGAATEIKLRVQWPHGSWSEWKAASANQQLVMDKDAGTLAGRAP
jgi:enediyne biosynthesis protein E4